MSSTCKTLFERNTVPIGYVYTFLDLPDIVRSSAVCKKAKEIALNKIVWQGLAPSFGLPKCRWPEYSLEQGKANVLLIKRVCSLLYKDLRKEGQGLRSQFRTQVKPDALRLSYNDICEWIVRCRRDISTSSALAELIAVTRDPKDPAIFQNTIQTFQAQMGHTEIRGAAMNAFLCLAQHGFIPETHNSLDFIWNFWSHGCEITAGQLVKTLLTNPRFEASPDCFHIAVCANLACHFDCLTTMIDKGVAKLLPKRRDPELGELPSTLDFVVQNKNPFVLPKMLKLLLGTGAVPTSDTLFKLLSRSYHFLRIGGHFYIHPEQALEPNPVMEAIAILADAKIAGLFAHPFILSYACLFKERRLMDQLRAAGAKCSAENDSNNTLDYALGFEPKPEMVSLLLKFGAEPSQVTTTILYETYQDPNMRQDIENTIFPDGIPEGYEPDDAVVAQYFFEQEPNEEAAEEDDSLGLGETGAPAPCDDYKATPPPSRQAAAGASRDNCYKEKKKE